MRAAGDPRGHGARIRAGVRARGRGLRGGVAEGRRHLRDPVVQQPRADRRRLQRVHDRDARRPARHRLLHGPRQRRAAKRQVLLRGHLERRQLRHRDLLRRMGQRRHERASALPAGGLVHLVPVRPDRARQGLGQQLHHGRQRLLLARGRRLRRVRQLGRRERPHRRRREHDHQRFRLRALRLPRRRVLFRARDNSVPRLRARRFHLPGRRRLGRRRTPLRRPGLGRTPARIPPERPDRLQDCQGRLRGQRLKAPGRRVPRRRRVHGQILRRRRILLQRDAHVAAEDQRGRPDHAARQIQGRRRRLLPQRGRRRRGPARLLHRPGDLRARRLRPRGARDVLLRGDLHGLRQGRRHVEPPRCRAFRQGDGQEGRARDPQARL